MPQHLRTHLENLELQSQLDGVWPRSPQSDSEGVVIEGGTGRIY